MPNLKYLSRIAIAPVLLLTIGFPSMAAAQSSAGTTVKVMTYNVNEGTDFDAIIGVASNPSATAVDFAKAVNDTVAEVQGTNPVLRTHLIANAIATAQPDLVGLQEAAVWTFGDQQVDLLQLILADLPNYEPVIIEPEFQIDLNLLQFPFHVGFIDRDVILARTDEPLTITAKRRGHYTAQVPLPSSTFLPATSITRGWAYVDARVNGKAFRFVTTHLEDGTSTISPIFALVQALQAIQLVYGPALTALPVIIGGDFNTVANDPSSVTFLTYEFMLANGFTDAWRTAHPDLAGLTCCQEHLQNSTSELTQRIDLVFSRNHVTVVGAELVGDHIDASAGFWPSDHAAVAAVEAIAKSH